MITTMMVVVMIMVLLSDSAMASSITLAAAIYRRSVGTVVSDFRRIVRICSSWNARSS